MTTFLKILKRIGLGLLVLLIGLAVYLRVQYGGGNEYPDVSTDPKYGSAELVEVIAHPDPIGNVAVSKDTVGPHRVFFTIHPESRPETIKLVEIINGQAEPYPSLEDQSLFSTVLGVFTDQQNRLWTIDHGNHGFEPVKLLAFDLATNELVHEYAFPKDVAKKLSFFNDLSVSPDGQHIVVANVSFFGKKPSIAVYDLQSGESRNRLEGHESMKHESYVPVTPNKKMRFFGGLVDLLTGIDGIDFTRDGEYVYWAPMGHSKLFRVATSKLTDFSLTEAQLAEAVEEVATKPLSDGIRTDFSGNVYITDIENQGIYVISPGGKGHTLIKDERIRWADGLSLAMDGTFYLADSDIPNQMLMSKKNMAENSPYHIFKFSSLD